MFELLLIVVGCYALAALLVHLAYWFGRGRHKVRKHYVLITGREQKDMEWYLRSLFSFARWMGKNIQLTVVDRGDSNEAMAVVERWSRSDDHIKMFRGKDESDQQEGKDHPSASDSSVHLLWILQAEGIVSEADHAVLVDLQNPADLSKMPF